MRVAVATGNRGKLAEFRSFLEEMGFEVLGLDAFPGFVLPPEGKESFAANAVAKARALAGHAGLSAIADDSGLEVEAIGGRPGVLSARFAGEGASDEANNARLLAELAGVAAGRRRARYRAVVALAVPGGRGGISVVTAEGVSEGEILDAPRGSGGFGYDPLFLVPELGKTFAELEPAERREVSHRFRALRALRPALERLRRRRRSPGRRRDRLYDEGRQPRGSGQK